MITFSSFIWPVGHQLNYAFGGIIIESVKACGFRSRTGNETSSPT